MVALTLEFGADLSITYVMGGLARELGDRASMIVPWFDVSEAPLSLSYPVCMAVKAAEQGSEVPAALRRVAGSGS